ncbi:hypothetical protein HPB47_013075 [Ixodes persulcatus]|uniref:Uncharacterized protein n=1 Tax=Ixodes persulcatus TaxID=34615 RepID=A0AC60NRS1_IXOPE|nr:hypothetical protein HPB47_013075 [Ixodes persulcatus]
MVELRSARKCEASQPPQAPKPAREETPMEVPVEAPSEARTAKKRTLTKPVRDEELEEFQTEMRVMLKSLSEAVAMLNDKVDVLDGKFNALEARRGVHNTLEEIIEAQETAQVARLSSSPAGRKILAVLGLNPTLVAERRHQLSDAQRASIQTSPFPFHVHPQHNVGRRRARAVALLRHVRDEPRSACFVDAAQYGRSARFAAVAIDHKVLLKTFTGHNRKD